MAADHRVNETGSDEEKCVRFTVHEELAAVKVKNRAIYLSKSNYGYE